MVKKADDKYIEEGGTDFIRFMKQKKYINSLITVTFLKLSFLIDISISYIRLNNPYLDPQFSIIPIITLIFRG